MTRRRILSSLLGAVVAVAFDADSARAAPPKEPSVEITVIHALYGDGGLSIDPRLRDLSQLTRDEPFVRYNVYRLLDRARLSLQRGKSASYTLVNGRTLQVTLLDVTDNKGESRYHVRAEIGEPGKRAFLKLLEVTASANEPFFVGGQTHDGGTLFVELAVRP
jgi:hypothetical protein